MKKKPYNAADPKQAGEAKEKAELEKEQYLKDLKELLDTPAGIRVFSKIIEKGKMFSSSFTGNSTTFFNEGMRNIILDLFGDICEAAPDRVGSIILKAKEITDD